jgi:hypothetical protein
MRAGLLIMLLIGFGCAGPEAPPNPRCCRILREYLSSRRLPPERDRAIEGRYFYPSVGWGLAGEALNRAATAVRMPKL